MVNPKIHQIYDKTYKKVFSYPIVLKQFIEAFVNKKLAKSIVECELQKSDFISKEYKAFSSDLIYKVKLKNKNQEMFIFVLFEFKSQPVYYIALHLLNYICLFYVQMLKEWKHKEPLPPVLPIVIYNCDARYNAPLNISELIDSRLEVIQEYIPSFKYFCFDINTLDVSKIRKLIVHTYNIAALLFHVEIVDEDKLIKEVNKVFDIVKNSMPDDLLEEIYLYFMSFLKPTQKEIKELLPLVKQKEFSMLATKIENIRKKEYEKGLNEGMMKGLNEGIIKGKIEALTKAFEITKDLNIAAEIAGFDKMLAEKILKDKGLL